MRNYNLLFSFCLGLFFISAKSQDNVSSNNSFTYGEFKFGYGITQFGNGLKENFEAGNFSTSSGGVGTIAAYHKFNKIPFLNFGVKFKALGGAPSSGDDGYEMFFNYWGTGFGLKYFPFQREARSGIFIGVDYYYTSQFTQKYRNTTEKIFNHQFAIGSAFSGAIGYDISYKNVGFVFGMEYEIANRQGEVSGVGDKNFSNSTIAFLAGIKF
jgi:hypothetical protein